MERSWAKVGGAVWVYIVRCAGGRLYTGVKDDPVRRFEEHKNRGSRFTTGYPAEELIFTERHADRRAALKRERQIKGWTRAKKLALAAGDLELLKGL